VGFDEAHHFVVSELHRQGKSSGQKIAKSTKQHRGYTLGILQQKFRKGYPNLSWVHPRQYFVLRGGAVVDHDNVEDEPECDGCHDYVEDAPVDDGDNVQMEDEPEYDGDHNYWQDEPERDGDHDYMEDAPVDDGGHDYVEDEMVNANPSGYTVIEVSHLIKPGKGTVVGLLQQRAPWINAEPFIGKRSFARVRVTVAQEAAACAAIKDFARDSGVRADIKVVERRFDSPRD
jgi:hypothetical protein